MGAAIACTLAEMQLFYQTLNFSNTFLGFMGAAAYLGYATIDSTSGAAKSGGLTQSFLNWLAIAS